MVDVVKPGCAARAVRPAAPEGLPKPPGRPRTAERCVTCGKPFYECKGHDKVPSPKRFGTREGKKPAAGPAPKPAEETKHKNRISIPLNEDGTFRLDTLTPEEDAGSQG